MSGITPAFVLSREAELSELVYDRSGCVAKMVADGLTLEAEEMLKGYAFAILVGSKILGGVVFSDYRAGDSAWISIYTTDKRWCTAKILKQIFGLAFDALHCRRLNALICADNRASISLSERCGFVCEGRMRNYFDDGADALIFGMLRSECKFINNQYKENENVQRI